jgi:RNase P/RNase MRP subunit p29
MISDEDLNQFRVNGTKLRVIRDAETVNDVKGIVVAWDEQTVVIRKQNRNVVKLARDYIYQPWELER